MKIPKKISAIMLISLLAITMTACASSNKDSSVGENKAEVSQSTNNSKHYPVTITTYNQDKEEVEIVFKEAPKSVLAVYQNSIETLLALGLEDHIVAAAGLDHKVKTKWEEAFSKVKYLNEFTPSKENSIMLQPDFILGWYSLFDDKALGDVDYWHKSDINTYMSQNSGTVQDKTIKNECEDILNIGKIFDAEKKAQALVDDINGEIEKVSKNVEGKEKVSTLIVEFSEDNIRGYGADSLAGDMATKLGAKVLNEKGNDLSKEGLVDLNPETIFVVYMDRDDKNVSKESVDKILDDRSLASLDAVKNKRVYPIALGEMYASGVRTIDGINTFANGLYPDIKGEK